MTVNQDSKAVKYQWLRWISRILLIAAVLSCAFFTICFIPGTDGRYDSWDSWFWFFTIPAVIVIIIAWFFPMAGGVLAIVCSGMLLSYTFLGLLFDGGDDYYRIFLPRLFESIFLLIGGILSIKWSNWQRENKE